jgi:Protein of unknown function (DUF3987)
MAAAYAGPDTELAPNAADMAAFLAWWFQHCKTGVIEIGCLDAGGRGIVTFEQFALDDIQGAVAVAVLANMVPGQSIYVRAATVHPRRSVGEYTTDLDFMSAPGIWGDIDTLEDLERARTVRTLVRPNASVITGRVPHMRVQNWFLCDSPILLPEQVRALNVRLHALYGGDPAVVNPSRLMRLPGSIAWPWKPGRVPEVTQFIRPGPDDKRPASYPIAMLLTQLPEVGADGAARGRKSTEEPFDAGGPTGGMGSVSRLIATIKSGKQWHNAMIRLVAHWVGQGRSSMEILGHAADWTLAGYTVAQTRVEVSKAIDGARERWGVPDADPAVSGGSETPFGEALWDPWGELVAPPFPIDALPDVLRAYVEARARIMGADPCAIAWSALSACSAALDGRTRMRMKKQDTSWMVPPSLWVALIGEPSTKKTPIVTETWAPLQALQNVAVRAYMDQVAQWKKLAKKEREDTEPPPPPRRLITNDATIESLQGILSAQDRGIALIFDELAQFIGGMDRYSNGRGGGDRAFFLRAYTGGSHIVDRVNRGMVPINNLLVTIIGGIQPDRLASFKDLTDDGLWQRFIPIITPVADLGVDESDAPTMEGYALRLQGMVDVSRGDVASFSVGANGVRVVLEEELFRLERMRPLGPKFSSFLGKLPGVFGRLCLTLAYIEPKGMGYIVRQETAEAARTLIMRCVIPHAIAVYIQMGDFGEVSVEHIQAVAGYILTKAKTRIVTSDLTSDVRVCRGKSVPEIGKIVSPLIAGGWLLPENELPTCRAWMVNPIVHTRYADRAESERVRRQTIADLLKS